VRGVRVWARLIGLQRTVVENVRIGSEAEVIVSARPSWRERGSLRGVSAPIAGL